MRREILTGLGFLLVASSVAFAQNAPAVGGDTATKTASSGNPPAKATEAGANLQQTLSDNLKKAGYTDIKIEPDAFIVEAKGKSGQPTVMFLTPDSMTVFTAKDAKGQNSQTATGGSSTE